MMQIEDIIERFNTTPFLFIGSGMSRRYLNLPNWEELLKHFAELISTDEFSYDVYRQKAMNIDHKAGTMPKIAELIQQDFDQKWFADINLRTVGQLEKNLIHDGLSPFKAELAAYIKNETKTNTQYQSEIDKLSDISKKSIAGVITTNYDTFLEDHFKGYTKYVGQSQLIFSVIQGVAEIYKIHGSVEVPKSIIINEEDYVQFEKNCSYLAAKLMTIFMEYPIIFMGYSIRDKNIQNIISAIIACLDSEQIEHLEDRFLFIEYKEDIVSAEVSPFAIVLGDKPLTIKRAVLSDFMPLYNAMERKKQKLPVSILRKFKQELYEYTVTNTPTANLRVASIDDERVDDEDLVLAIGKASVFGLKGLSGISGNEWYQNIILDNLEFTADEMLEYAFPILYKQNSNKLPLNKYLKEAIKRFDECEKIAEKQDFNAIISETFKNDRKCLGQYSSVKEIWKNEKSVSIDKALRLIAHLQEDQIDTKELEEVLVEIFHTDRNILQNVSSNERTNIRRVVRIYDYLKWGK